MVVEDKAIKKQNKMLEKYRKRCKRIGLDYDMIMQAISNLKLAVKICNDETDKLREEKKNVRATYDFLTKTARN